MALKGSNKTGYQRNYMRKKRSNKATGLTEESNKGLTNEVGLTERSNKDVAQYPAIIYALADLEKRAKLGLICDSLKGHGREVTYGVSGPDFGVVSELLEAF